jgi:hypothetical protein
MQNIKNDVFSGLHPERLKNIQSEKHDNHKKNTGVTSKRTGYNNIRGARGKGGAGIQTINPKQASNVIDKKGKKNTIIHERANVTTDVKDDNDTVTKDNTATSTTIHNNKKIKPDINRMVLTIDVGLKNLAMCIMDSQYNIHLWDVYNMLDDEQYSYSCQTRQKDGKMCEKKCQYKFPKEVKKKPDELGASAVNIEPIVETIYTCKRHYPKDLPNQKKYFIKEKKVGDFLLQDIAERIMKGINEIYNKHLDLFNSITNICIELQPKVNQRMKFTSHIIYAKFVDLYKERNGEVPIRFIRASQNLQAYRGPPVECKLKTPYSKRKYLSVAYTKWYLEHDLLCNEFNKSKKYMEFLLSHPKKDDLCDVSNANINVHKGLKKKQKINKNGSEIK